MKKTDLLFIQITPECNMDCLYCPFSYRNPAQNRTRNFDLQLESIKNMAGSKSFSEDSFNELIVYGGEPLLYFDHTKRVVERYRSLRKNGVITICTNGMLITNDIIRYAKNNAVKFSINMDGDFSLVEKIKSISEAEWERLLFNLQKLTSEGVYFDFSTTLTPDFLDAFDAYTGFLLSLRPGMIGFNFLRDAAAQRRFAIIDPQEYLQKATRLVFRNISEKNFNRRKKLDAYKRNAQTPDCICSGMGLTVLADGQYTTCGIFPSQKYANPAQVAKAFEVNHAWLFSNPRLDKKTRDLPTFGGGCAKLGDEDNDRFASCNAIESFNRFQYEKI